MTGAAARATVRTGVPTGANAGRAAVGLHAPSSRIFFFSNTIIGEKFLQYFFCNFFAEFFHIFW